MGNPHQVLAFEKGRDRRSLNLGRRGKTGSFNIAQQGLDEVEPIKIRHKGKSFVYPVGAMFTPVVPAQTQSRPVLGKEPASDPHERQMM